jgi:hypothetical protein
MDLLTPESVIEAVTSEILDAPRTTASLLRGL